MCKADTIRSYKLTINIAAHHERIVALSQLPQQQHGLLSLVLALGKLLLQPPADLRVAKRSDV